MNKPNATSASAVPRWILKYIAQKNMRWRYAPAPVEHPRLSDLSFDSGRSRPHLDHAEVLVQGLLNHFLRNVANDLFLYLAIFKQQQSRNAAHAIALRGGVILVHIHLADLETATVLRRDFINHGRQRAAGATPGRPEIHQNRITRFQNVRIKTRISHFYDAFSRHVFPSLWQLATQ